MKKSKKRKLFVFWWILSAFLLLTAIAYIPDAILWFLVYLAASVFCFSAGIANYKDTKQVSAKIEHAVPEQTSIKKKAAVSVSDAQRQSNRESFLLRKRTEFSNAVNSIPQIEIPLSDEKIKRRAVSDFAEIKFSNITRSTKIDNLFPLVVIDAETTGISPRGNDIIEVSAIKYDVGFTPISCFTTLLKPRKPIPSEATNVNHITDEMVVNSPSFSQVAPAFASFISGCNIVGHNLIFDLKFLFACGIDFSPRPRYFDTLSLAKHTLKVCGNKVYDHHTGEYVESDDFDVYDYKLDTLCEYYGIYRDDSHRSLSDCYATMLVFQNLINDKTD